MSFADCEFEAEVLAAALQSRWPEHVDAELRAHVPQCAICSEAALVASAIDEARNDMSQEMTASVALPDSGRVWWLAQLRARREAIAAAGRPITAIQLIAFACATGLLGACFGATSSWFQSALRWFQSQPLTALLAGHAVLAAGMAAAIVLLSTASYLAFGKD